MNLETRIQLLSTLRLPHYGMGKRTREINFDVFVIKSQYVIRTPYKKRSLFISTLPAMDKRVRISHYFLSCTLWTTLSMEHDKRNRNKIRKIDCLYFARPQEIAFPTNSQKTRNANRAECKYVCGYEEDKNLQVKKIRKVLYNGQKVRSVRKSILPSRSWHFHPEKIISYCQLLEKQRILLHHTYREKLHFCQLFPF